MSNPEFTAPDFTTQTAAQYKANLDAAIAANNTVTNLGFSYSAGTFTVHGHEGTALASTNPAFVRFQDPDNFGYNKFISVEAKQDFIDDAGASEIIGSLFGFTTGVAVAVDVPFYLYAVSNDAMDAVAFMISRVPHAVLSPATSLIGAPDDLTAASTTGSFYSLESLDETLYDTNPCVCLGSFRMQMSASDDWTVQALSAGDGIGQYNEGTTFTVPAGQFGADAGTRTHANTGTSAVFTTDEAEYQLYRNGTVNLRYYLNGDGGTDGSGSVAATVITPFNHNNNTSGSPHYSARVNRAGNDDLRYLEFAGTNKIIFRNDVGTTINWSNFSNGARELSFSIMYPVDIV